MYLTCTTHHTNENRKKKTQTKEELQYNSLSHGSVISSPLGTQLNGVFCFPPLHRQFFPQTMGDQEVNAPNITTHTHTQLENFTIGGFLFSYPTGPYCHIGTHCHLPLFFLCLRFGTRDCVRYHRSVYGLLNDFFGWNPVPGGLCWITLS